MASWSARRRAAYVFVILLVAALVAVVIVFALFKENPTCFDGIQNGDEDGIDCGGSCEQVCSFQTAEPVVLWSRFFEVVPGMYSAVAVVENPNTNIEAVGVPYSFKVRDDRGILIDERKGKAFIPSGEEFAVFESGITTGTRIPNKIFFEFRETPRWRQAVSQPKLEVSGVRVEDANVEPNISARVRNTTLNTVQNVAATAIVFGESGNAIAASRTVVDKIAAEGAEDIIFTWPRAFTEQVVRTEILTTVVPIQ